MGLPTELWDNVIDHIHDHKPTLLACARVCHAWLNSARYHLFHTMELTLREPKPRLLALAAFSKSHPEIAACIRTLRVQPALGLTSNPVEIQVLIVVVSVLPNLRTIALSQMQLDHSRKHDPTLPDITLEDAASTSVQSLSIRTVAQTRSLVDILRDLCLFPSLNTLELSFISWPDNEVDFCLLVPPIPLRLKTFTVGMMTDPSQLFRYIRTTPSVHTLTSLCLFGLRIPDVESAGLLIQDIGSSLLHFALSMEHFRSPAGWAGSSAWQKIFEIDTYSAQEISYHS